MSSDASRIWIVTHRSAEGVNLTTTATASSAKQAGSDVTKLNDTELLEVTEHPHSATRAEVTEDAEPELRQTPDSDGMDENGTDLGIAPQHEEDQGLDRQETDEVDAPTNPEATDETKLEGVSVTTPEPGEPRNEESIASSGPGGESNPSLEEVRTAEREATGPAKARAAELGIDIATLEGEGKISKADVEKAHASRS